VAETFDDVARSKYLLLTTFTKDGRPKPTAVWGARDGDKLLIITDDGSWKAKRIRNTSRVTIQRSGGLGQAKGEPVEAVARILPKKDTRRVYDAVVKRYLVARVVVHPAFADQRWHRQGAHRAGDQACGLARCPLKNVKTGCGRLRSPSRGSRIR